MVAPAVADTIDQALAKAYVNNPQLNSQRAVVRETDEGVPQALSGYKPRITGTASTGHGAGRSAVNHIHVSWNAQADKKAKDYLSISAFSKSGLIDQLMFDGFTAAQARHGAASAGL